MLSEIHQRLPAPIQPIVGKAYKRVFSIPKTERTVNSAFVDKFFESKEEFQHLAEETQSDERIQQGLSNLSTLRKRGQKLGALPTTYARTYYALIRKLEPTTLVETGVCNGKSTLFILAALDANNHGSLYSIDYPFRADENLEDFRAETYREFGGAAIPSDQEPGWIIPNTLIHRWELQTGKSQRELPKLLSQIDEIDWFVHDSEHSTPCTLMEMELGYERLSETGILFVDDISWTDAFEIFVSERDCSSGLISDRIGYVR